MSPSSTMDTLFVIIQRVLQQLPVQAEDILNQLRHVTPLKAAFGGLLAWMSVVRLFRWRRYNAIHREFGPKWNNGKGKITPEEAQKIMHVSSLYDMPLLLNYALAFALFKTYGIPSISKLLASTKELKSKETVSRRYADTEILISTWFACPISGFLDAQFAEANKVSNPKPADDPRAMIALARVNWLHSRHKISNDDYLYTLCLFALEPATWAARYGWRALSPLEQQAYYVFWTEIGRRMGVHDIPDTIEGMIEWSKGYERTYMVPAETNQEVAQYTVSELLAAAPKAFGIKSFGRRTVVCLMDDIVREAMMYEKQPRNLHYFVNGAMGTVAFVQRWLLLPAFSDHSSVDLCPTPRTKGNGECPRLHPRKWAARPWYRPEATGLGYYRDKLLVALGWYTEMPGPHLKSSGYRLEEMGPFGCETSAHEEIMRNAAELQGCPVAGPWSLEGRQKATELGTSKE